MAMLTGGSLAGLPVPRSGKVRDVYDLGSELLIVASDRISAFDVVMPNGVPDKGRILNQLSLFWFKRLESICRHHVIASDDETLRVRFPDCADQLVGRSIIAQKASVIPIECVARGFITGSLFKEYRRDGRNVHGLDLPDGLSDGSRLPEPIFTPATKAQEGHDANISFPAMADQIGTELAGMLRDLTLRLYNQAAEFATTKGLILADTKFEFGLTSEGLIWIDEALTPDSSRYWEAASWNPGRSQPSYDKQFVRDYLEEIGWDKQPPAPMLPDEVIARTREKYLQAFERLTGQPLHVASL